MHLQYNQNFKTGKKKKKKTLISEFSYPNFIVVLVFWEKNDFDAQLLTMDVY